jgi:hypothetical protein
LSGGLGPRVRRALLWSGVQQGGLVRARVGGEGVG